MRVIDGALHVSMRCSWFCCILPREQRWKVKQQEQKTHNMLFAHTWRNLRFTDGWKQNLFLTLKLNCKYFYGNWCFTEKQFKHLVVICLTLRKCVEKCKLTIQAKEIWKSISLFIMPLSSFETCIPTNLWNFQKIILL